MGLLDALREAGIPASRWPALLTFDSLSSEVAVVSCMRQPWDELGREAAQILWERATGRRTGPQGQNLVTMQTIPRLTCRPDWANSVSTRARAAEPGQISRSQLGALAEIAPV